MAVKNYKELIAWQKAMDFVERVYRATTVFPKDETYGLRSQLRRAVVSVPSNIAEGQGRRGAKEFVHFLCMGHGSLREAETQIIIAQRLEYLDERTVNELLELAAEVGRLINGLINSISE
jgi:four helix bundle protein